MYCDPRRIQIFFIWEGDHQQQEEEEEEEEEGGGGFIYAAMTLLGTKKNNNDGIKYSHLQQNEYEQPWSPMESFLSWIKLLTKETNH